MCVGRAAGAAGAVGAAKHVGAKVVGEARKKGGGEMEAQRVGIKTKSGEVQGQGSSVREGSCGKYPLHHVKSNGSGY